jgi:hypothetical protein
VCVYACIALWTRLDSGCRSVVLHRRARSCVEGFADSVSQLHIAVSMTTVVFLAPPARYWASVQRSDRIGGSVVVAAAATVWFAIGVCSSFALFKFARSVRSFRPHCLTARHVHCRYLFACTHLTLFDSISKSPILSLLDLSFLPSPVRSTPSSCALLLRPARVLVPCKGINSHPRGQICHLLLALIVFIHLKFFVNHNLQHGVCRALLLLDRSCCHYV